MTARLHDTAATTSHEPIAELSVFKLLHDTDVDDHRRLPVGSLGAIVFVHNEGEAYEVEFVEPFAAVVTLRPSDIEPQRLGREQLP